ncbi:VPA1269 family protein [Vibrio breoganii]|uniref:gamma-mobile-trio integrase GmtZ n=1 Tax=Vibrio breoganii TaxID=553239 RepID=UPI000C8581D8|nr:VPA1269 family protein [Vibrio breoganii]PMO79228.1 integrase [Vibrio breoganii]PMO86763.1 integrase [Vibrio breoganii]
MAKNIYSSLKEAQEATIRLGISSCVEYQKRYKEDSRLPSSPDYQYALEWLGWPSFLKKNKDKKYKQLHIASKAVQKLKILSEPEYRKRYKEDPFLPSNPNRTYKKDWVSWYHFLGKEKIPFYETLSEASSQAIAIGIKTPIEYRNNYQKDGRLPPFPQNLYAREWKGWINFLKNKEIREKYKTLKEASLATRVLGISSETEYRTRYKEDQRLPAVPSAVYSKHWVSWYNYLGKRKKIFYKTLSSASDASIRLKINSATGYKNRYKEDDLLPQSPERYYIKDWISWEHFLGMPEVIRYPYLFQASEAAVSLGINTEKEYKKRHKEDDMLPSSPPQFYRKEWVSWPQFLGREKKQFYKNLKDASVAAQKLGIKSGNDYQQKYRKDPLLPSAPRKFYKNEWVSWQDFLAPKNFTSTEDFRLCCEVLRIRNSVMYREARKKYTFLPSKPEKNIPEWTSWYDALDIPRPYKYDDLAALVKSNGITSLAQYQKFRTESNDPRIPVKPEEHYKGKGWTNTYDFWGTPRPYQVNYFTEAWRLWAEKITEFLTTARGGDTKAKDLCEFVREYIEPNGFDTCPLDFLTRGSTNIQPMLDLFEQVPVTRKKKWIFSINEFLDWIIANYLILEDTETGEVTYIKGAKNPFSHVNFNGDVAPQVINETDKMALPYQYVKAGREWIFPLDSVEKNLSYRDLAHLHRCSSDWVQINDCSLLDKSDPDCVFKFENGKTYLWFPAYWTYTYSLMQLPARGIQIVYCDSGEADQELADFKNSKIVWKKNRTLLAGLTNRQSMVSKSGQGEIGVHYTSNKTKFDGSGYTIPFMPLELAYWLVKLRKWQQKYNPLKEPTRWLDCERTNLNETQRKQKGINCFLFRDYGEKEPGTFSGRLTVRLAATLYFSARNDITTATYKGLKYNRSIKELENSQTIRLYHFKSPYTPHSMRVSLINAYAYEFGIPLEVIMKLVGHSSIIMSIYYLKSDKTGANLREKMELGEKEALNKATQTLKSFVEQQRIEEVKSQLVGSSMDLLNSLDNARPASSYLWKDFGICPVGGAFCSEGGCPVATKANIYHPVPAGYLGEQNCFQCRFFITGPAFLVGLAAMFNEISLAVNTQSIRYTSLGQKLDDIAEKIDVIDHQLYKIKADSSEKSALESDRRGLVGERMHLNSEIETRAKKLDLYLSDMNAIHRHIHNCQTLMRNPKENTKNHYQLIVPHEFTLGVELDEVSNFHQLSEVCSNAELYHSCSDDLAVTRRSQMIDKMMVENGIQPQFFLLSEEEQLAVGNQLTELMLARLKGWENVDRLMDGSLTLKDLSIDNQFDEKTIRELFEKSKPLKRIG